MRSRAELKQALVLAMPSIAVPHSAPPSRSSPNLEHATLPCTPPNVARHAMLQLEDATREGAWRAPQGRTQVRRRIARQVRVRRQSSGPPTNHRPPSSIAACRRCLLRTLSRTHPALMPRVLPLSATPRTRPAGLLMPATGAASASWPTRPPTAPSPPSSRARGAWRRASPCVAPTRRRRRVKGAALVVGGGHGCGGHHGLRRLHPTA